MPIELRKQRDGSLRDTWYARYEVNGKLHFMNLGVKLAGTPPASLSIRDEGDAAFERSRATAQAKLDAVIEEVRTKRNSAALVEKLYEIKTGEQIKSVTLAGLPDEWARIPRRHTPNARYASQCQSTLRRFAGYITQQNSKAEEIAQVTRPLARAFMDTETDRGVTAKTWNETLKLLRATFKYLLPAGAINPFSDMPTRDTETVFRIPFSPEELKAIMDAAKDDDFIRPLLAVGICTAMRRGDCCLLAWKDVNLAQGFITVKTAKTGQTVSIPIFPMLYDELSKIEKGKKDYVFPEQASMYLENPDGITWRVKKVLAQALGESEETEPTALPEASDQEVLIRGLKHIAAMQDTEKKRRMATVFKAYMDGKKTCETMETAGVSKGSVSGYLNEIESAIGFKVVRGRAEGGSLTALLKTDSELLRKTRKGGQRRASVRDFHSFRVTWVTLALTAGVALELVQKVTGHKTTDIVLKHYFQPGREDFRRALESAMPKLLTHGHKSPKDEIKALADAMKSKPTKKDKARLLELLAKI